MSSAMLALNLVDIDVCKVGLDKLEDKLSLVPSVGGDIT